MKIRNITKILALGLVVITTACSKNITELDAKFEANKTSIAVGEEIDFKITGSGDYYSFWSGEPGQSGKDIDENIFVHTYFVPGTYQAKLISTVIDGRDLTIERDSTFIEIVVTDAIGTHNQFQLYSFTLKKVFEGFEDRSIRISVDGEINNNEVVVNVPYSTNVTDLTASFETKSTSTVYVGDVVQESRKSTNDFTNPVVYTIVSNDGTKVNNTVTVNRLPQDHKNNLSGFELAGLPGNITQLISESNNGYNIVLSDATDASNLTAKFTIPTFARVYVNNVEQVAEETPLDFSNSVTYKVVAENGDAAEYSIKVDFTPKFTRFYFGDNNSFVGEGVYNSTNDTVFVNAPAGADLTNLVASFESNLNNTKVYVGSTEQTSGSSANNFTEPVTYTLQQNINNQIVVVVR